MRKRMVVAIMLALYPAGFSQSRGEELRAAARVNAPLAVDDEQPLLSVEHSLGGVKKWEEEVRKDELLQSALPTPSPTVIEGTLRPRVDAYIPTKTQSGAVEIQAVPPDASLKDSVKPKTGGRIVGKPRPYEPASGEPVAMQRAEPPLLDATPQPLPIPVVTPRQDSPASNSPLLQEAERPLPGLPDPSTVPRIIVGGQPIAPYTPPPNVLATPMPNPDDGLQGNRQVALTPFPNLYMQAGPLAAHQLPWYHQLPEEQPYTFLRSLEFNSLIGAMKSNGVDNSQGGWYNSLQAAIPFWTERQVGMQFGGGFEPNMLQTNYFRLSGGFFRRAIWPLEADIVPGLFQRLSGGTVYDGVYDSEHRVYVGQVRSQIAYALAPSREVGAWFTIPMQGSATNVGPNAPLTIDATTTYYFYYRQTFPSEVDATLFAGWAEGPGGMNIGTYLSYHFAQQASLISWGMFNLEAAGANALYFGLCFHFAPHEDYTLISGNPQNRYRPFLRMADPIQLQLRKTAAIVP